MKNNSMPKPTVYTAFANCDENEIANLSAEALQITDTFQPLAFNDKLYYLKDEMCDLRRLVGNFQKYGERFDLFYFAGHGKNGCLQLANNFTTQPETLSDAISASLKNAKLLFFNACETFALAQQIIQKKQKAQSPVIISCGGEIKTFHAETFATLLLKQIGQLGTIRDAYDQAKALLNLMTGGTVKFREFDNAKDVLDCEKNFDIAYIEIKNKQDGNGTEKEKPPRDSMIGKDELTRDVLTANYLSAVVESLASAEERGLVKDKADILHKALKAADAVVKGRTDSKQANVVFEQAAAEIPGISSGKTFNSIINAQKHLKDPYVQSYIKTSDFAINNLVKKTNAIKV
jgi:hypothetical protein